LVSSTIPKTRTLQPQRSGLISINVIAIWLVFFQTRIIVHLNMSERENGQLPLAKRTARSTISADIWEQIKTAHAGGIGLREIARNMGIPEGTVIAHAWREGWTQQIKSAKALVKREDASLAVTPMEAVAVTLNERKDKAKLNLSRYAVEASEKAANHRQKLKIARQVKEVAAVAGSVWPAEKHEGPNLMVNIALLGIDPESVRVDQRDA
jgi:hypothetical protein